MGNWTICSFQELNSQKVERGNHKTDPSVRLHVTGGETVTSAPVEVSVKVDAIVTSDELQALRDRLAYGDTGAVDLFSERIEFCQLVEITDVVNVYDSDTWTCSLLFEQVSDVVNPVITVYAGSSVVGDVLGFSSATGRLSRYCRATINCATKHGRRGERVRITGNVNFGTDLLFDGIVERVSSDYWPSTWTVECVGRFKLLDRQWSAQQTFSGWTDGAIVSHLIAQRGLPQADIEEMGWTLGTRAPAIFQAGDASIQWIDQLDEITGYTTYERVDGRGIYVTRRRNDPVQVGTPRWTFTEGDNVLSVRWAEDLDGIRNHAIVTGLALEASEVKAETSATSSALDALMPATAPNYNAITVNSPLIETNTRAATIAARLVRDLNRVQQKLEITVPFLPAILVDDTIEVTIPSLNLHAVHCLVWDIKHEFDGEGGQTVITTNTGTIPSAL